MGLQARLAQATSRQDGYSEQSILDASKFQRAIETSSNPDYSALRAVLAQSRQFTMSFDDMLTAYNAIAK